MHHAELTFTPTAGAIKTKLHIAQSWSQFSSSVGAVPPVHASPTTSRHHGAPVPSHTSQPLPAWSEQQQQHQVPEYLTRRFVEKASQNRLTLLQKRLAEGRDGPGWTIALWKAHSTGPYPQAGSRDAGRPRSSTPPPRPRPSSPLTFQTNNVARTRPRSASPPAAWARAPRSASPPPTWSRAPRSANPRPSWGRAPRSVSPPSGWGKRPTWADPLAPRQNLLCNDFIQVPAAGTYRHLEKQYTTDYSTVEERLNKLERWCQQFQHTYSPRAERSLFSDQGEARAAATPAPAARLAAHVKSSPRSSAGAAWADSPAWQSHNVATVSPASTIVYSPVWDAAQASSPTASGLGAAATDTFQLAPRRLWQPEVQDPSSPAPSLSPAQVAGLGRTLHASHISTTAGGRPNPDVLPSRARSPSPAVHQHSTITLGTALHPGPPLDVARPTFRSTLVEAGSLVASQGSLEAWSDGMRQAWEQMERLPEARPAWVSPVELVSPASLHKFGAGPAQRGRGRQGAGHSSSSRWASGSGSASAAAAEEGSGRAVGLSHRERLQAGIRDLQTEMKWLREEMGRKGVALPTVEMDTRRATTPAPGKMWG